MALTYEQELTRLLADVKNTAQAHGRRPEELLDALIDRLWD